MSIAEYLEKEDGPRSKRVPILEAAVQEFGAVGYESTKWADVAERVGIGQTALYHYFESKAHCLFTIMRLQLQRSHEAFVSAVDSTSTPPEALRAVVRAAYDLPDDEVLQMRILQSNFSLLATPRSSEKEESERQRARELTRLIERDWANLLLRGMKSAHFPERDAALLAQAALGLVVSVWRWYRPGGPLSLVDVAEFMTASCVRLVECG
jgi:AcrR family transcriptional regulator